MTRFSTGQRRRSARMGLLAAALGASCGASHAPAAGVAPPREHSPPEEHAVSSPTPFQAPPSIHAEHERIHADLVQATEVEGAVGAAARELANVLHAHFVREEQIALPPLGLLQRLAAGEFSADMLAVLPLTDALRTELPQMLREHEAIGAAARRLEEVARAAGNAEVVGLAQALLAHAQSEEEVLYPAAILVGDVLRARSSPGPEPNAGTR